MTKYIPLCCWTDSLIEADVNLAVLEILQWQPTTDRELRSIHQQLHDAMVYRLGLEPMWSAEETYIEIRRPFATHYLQTFLSSLLFSVIPQDHDPTLRLLADIHKEIPQTARWLCNQKISDGVDHPSDLPNEYWGGTPISRSRTFEFCLGAFWSQQMLLFYIWDED